MKPARAARADDGRSRWIVLAMLFVCRSGLGLQFQTVGSIGEELSAEYAFSHTQIGTLIGMFMLPGMLVALPSGYAGRYLSDRALVGIGLLTLGAGGFVVAAADGFGLLGTGRIVCGIGFVLSTLYFTKMVADWFAGKELATAMAVLVTSWPFGIAVGQIAYPSLAGAHGWRAPFVVSAAYCILAAVAVLLAYRPPLRNAREAPRASSALPRRELTLTLIAAVVWALFNAGYVVYLSFAPQLLVAHGYAPAAAAGIISVASWTMIFSGALWGQIADRSGRRDLVLYACLLVGIGSLAFLRQKSLAVPLSFAFGFMGIAPAGVIMALVAESMAPERRAFGMGVFLTAFFLVLTPAPGLAGWLYDRSGDADSAILFAIALFVATALANVAFRMTQRRLPAPAA